MNKKPPETAEEIAAALFAGNPNLADWRLKACLPSKDEAFLRAVLFYYKQLGGFDPTLEEKP